MLGEKPILQYAGSNVNLTISTECLNLMIMESGEVILVLKTNNYVIWKIRLFFNVGIVLCNSTFKKINGNAWTMENNIHFFFIKT